MGVAEPALVDCLKQTWRKLLHEKWVTERMAQATGETRREVLPKQNVVPLQDQSSDGEVKESGQQGL